MATNQASTAEQVSTAHDGGGHTDKVAHDRELFCPRLEQLLCTSAQAHGLRGTLASVTASIERGGAGGGGEDPNLGMLRRIGWQEGRHDDYDPSRRPSPVLEGYRESERRFRLLSAKHQATHLAHYLGTSRCHPTLLATFGDLDGGGVAGVVIERWLIKRHKARARNADGKTVAAIEAVRVELAPLEQAIAEAQAVLDAPIALPAHDGPRPERPEVPPIRSEENPDGISKAARSRLLKPYNTALRAWQAPISKAAREAQRRRQQAVATLLTHEALVPALRAESARLCAELATADAASTAAGDEQALVDLCQKLNEQGQEGRTRRDDMIRAAEADVRAAHRAWRETGKKTAKDWANETTTA